MDKPVFYLLTAVIDVGGGVAFGGAEWHELYITKMPPGIPDVDLNNAVINQHLRQRHPKIDITMVKTRYGHSKIKIGEHYAWFARQKIQPTLAKTMLKARIVPYINLSGCFEKQDDLFAA